MIFFVINCINYWFLDVSWIPCIINEGMYCKYAFKQSRFAHYTFPVFCSSPKVVAGASACTHKYSMELANISISFWLGYEPSGGPMSSLANTWKAIRNGNEICLICSLVWTETWLSFDVHNVINFAVGFCTIPKCF